MVTGSIARPLNDSLKVSHEKAAFLIHTTSTPWCVLLPLSGWLGAMTGYLTSGGVPDDQAIAVLFESIPLNFYCIIAVVFALISCFAPVDFGPMKKRRKGLTAQGRWIIRTAGKNRAPLLLINRQIRPNQELST